MLPVATDANGDPRCVYCAPMARPAGGVPGPAGASDTGPEPGHGDGRGSDGDPEGIGRSGRGSAAGWPWAAAAMAAAVLVGLVHLATSSGTPLVFGGDQAVLALQVHEATRFHATLGPYSRFGWSHLGPALFYLFAPLYALTGGSPWSLLADSLLLNGVSLCLVLVVIRRFGGEWAARWALVPTGLVAVALGALSFETLWNPNLEGATVLLMVVLAAAACTGSGPSVVGVALVGTYLVQTDIGTVPVVGATAVCAVGGYAFRRLRQPAGGHRHRSAHAHARRSAAPGGTALPAAAPGGTAHRPKRRWAAWALGGAGTAVVAAAWIPPLVQQVTGHPGNISRLVHFFTTPQTGAGTAGSNHSFLQAWHVVANTVSVVPFGSVPATATFTNASTARQAVLAASLVASALAVGWAARRRHAFALGLGLVSLVGLVASLVAAMRIVGPVYSYLMLWAVFLPVPAWIALGILVAGLSDPDIRRRHATGAVRLGAAVVASLVLVVPIGLFARQLGDVPWSSAAPDRQVPAITAFASSRLAAASGRSVLLVIGNADRWPVVAGVMLALTDRGDDPKVQPAWAFMFTSRAVAGPGPHAELVFTDPAPGPADGAGSAPAGSTFLGPWGPTVVRFVPSPGKAG